MCQLQLAHAMLARGVCPTQPANARVYDLFMVVGTPGHVYSHFRGFDFVEIKVANCCLESIYCTWILHGPAVQRLGKHMAVLVHALDLEYQDQ